VSRPKAKPKKRREGVVFFKEDCRVNPVRLNQAVEIRDAVFQRVYEDIRALQQEQETVEAT